MASKPISRPNILLTIWQKYGMTKNIEVEVTPTNEDLLIRKRTKRRDPVDELVGT